MQPIDDHDYYIPPCSGRSDQVEAWNSCRLSFEPCHQSQRNFRRDLRTAVAMLTATPGELLHAVYGSTDDKPCDVENVLLYNVGLASLASAAQFGVRFERSRIIPPCPQILSRAAAHYHRYTVAPIDAPLPHWAHGTPLVRWHNIPIARSALMQPASVWHALKRTTRPLAQGNGSPIAQFGLRIRLTGPTARTLRAIDVLKPVFDGSIAALHRYEGAHLRIVSERLSQKLGGHSDTIAGWLQEDTDAVLGPHNVIYPYRQASVKWNPRDDLCVAGELVIETSDAAEDYFLSGELYALAP